MQATQSSSLVREVQIGSRFIGPDGIVNGGYLAGVLERDVGGASEISLLRPTTPDRRPSLHVPEASVRELRDGVDAPDPVSFEDAINAAERASFAEHPFPQCFVCGPERSATDALRVFSAVRAPRRVAAPVRFSRAFADRCVVVARVTGVRGRRRTAVSALYGEDGTLRACADALWITGRDQ